MGETAVLSRSVRSLHGLVEEQVKDPAKVINAEDEMEEAAERRPSKRGQSVRISKRKGKQAEEEVVTRELMGTNVVDAVSLELKSLKLNDDCNGNSRSSGFVLNAVPQEFVANMERSLARGDNAANARSSDEGDKDDNAMDLKSAAKQGYTSLALSQKDTAFLANLMREIQRGGDWKRLTAPHMKAYLRHHGLRISGPKEVLGIRVEQHLKIKAEQAEDIHLRSSFTINCQGDACHGDTVLFLQTVYDFCRPLGGRWVAGKVVHESYGAKEQQHTFTIEVLWSTGTKPCHFMYQLLIKGRNLYRMHTWRQPWINEKDREVVLKEKHDRGKAARKIHKDNLLDQLKPKGGSNSRPSSRSPSKTQHHANSSCNMAMQSSIQYDSQHKVYLGNSSVAASSRLPHFLQIFVHHERKTNSL